MNSFSSGSGPCLQNPVGYLVEHVVERSTQQARVLMTDDLCRNGVNVLIQWQGTQPPAQAAPRPQPPPPAKAAPPKPQPPPPVNFKAPPKPQPPPPLKAGPPPKPPPPRGYVALRAGLAPPQPNFKACHLYTSDAADE